MRLHEMLELPLLKESGVRIVTGADRLHRQVGWVHSGEIADIARFLNGGEVLLTAATGLGTSERAHRRYIRELGQAGVAAVIFELGRGLTSIPRAMVQEAEKTDLVLVSLDKEVPFVAVTHIVHTMLISSNHAALVRATEIDEALSQTILDGASLSAVLDLLADRLRSSVVLEDVSHRVVAFGRGPAAFAPVLKTWQAHSRGEHEIRRDATVNFAELPVRCAWTDVTLRGQTWGRLHILEGEASLDDVARLTVGRASTSIALLLMSERDAYLSEEAEHALIRGVASVSDFNGQEFMARAASLGVLFGNDLVVLVTAPEDDLGAPDHDPIADLIDACRAALSRTVWRGVVGRVEDAVVMIAAAEEDPTGDRAHALADRLVSSSSAKRVGQSTICRPAGLPRAYREAVMAHRLASLGSSTPLQNYDDLALLRLLAPLSAGPELATFVESELGELLVYDEGHNSELVKTLDAFLQANGNKQEMAELLHLRRRSVYYRLNRIEEILGYSLDISDRRARLYVALRGRDLLNDAGSQPS